MEDKIEVKMTPGQAEKFEAIKWLTDPFGARGSGRTLLLALAYVQHSANYGTWITVVNHGNNHPMANKELIDRIAGIVYNMEGYSLKVRGANTSHPTILIERIYKDETPIKEYKKFE